MNSAGHPGFSSVRDLQSQMWTEWDALAFDDEGQLLTEIPPGALVQFQAREVAVGVANVRCAEQFNQNGVLNLVDYELQVAFVERHGAELEAWAQYEEQRRAAQ